MQDNETTNNNSYSFRQFDVTENSKDFAKLDRTIKNAKKNEVKNKNYSRVKMTDIPQEKILKSLQTQKSISYVIEKKDEQLHTPASDSKNEKNDSSVFIGFCFAIKKGTVRFKDIFKVRIYSIDVIPEYESQYLNIVKLLLPEMINYIKNNCNEIKEVNMCASEPEMIEFLESLGFFKFEQLFRFYPNGNSSFKLKLVIPRPETTSKT